MPETPRRARPSFLTAVGRALGRRCPMCGRAPLFASWLRQVDHCAVCGERYAHIHADDAPPWLTILVVGHIVIPSALAVGWFLDWPTWLGILVWSTVAVGLSVVVLPRAKSVFLTAIWFLRAPGSEA